MATNYLPNITHKTKDRVSWLGQTKDYEIGFCCLFDKHVPIFS